MSVGFYLLGRKGYHTLNKFIEEYQASCISWVACGTDNKIKNDYSKEIIEITKKHNICCFGRIPPPSALNQDIIKFAIGWRWIIPDTSNLIVLHDSLLPKNRGFAPLVGSLISGENETGVTALRASKEYDKGLILGQEKINITYPKKINDLISDIEPLYSTLVCDIFEMYTKNIKIEEIEQVESDATYSLWLDEDDYNIDWWWDAQKIKRFIDAVGSPYSGAITRLNEKKIRIFHAEVSSDVSIRERERHVGKIIFMKNNNPHVICGNGILEITDIQDENGPFKATKFRSRFK